MLSKSQIKYIQSLGQKKPRDEENIFIAEGPKIVKELIGAKECKLKHVYALSSWVKNNKTTGFEITEITQHELEKISQLSTPNQVIALVEKIVWPNSPVLKGNISLVLDTIQDPGNMGTIIRLADWFGIKNIFCSLESVDLYNPKVVQASMGSIARVRVEYIDILQFLKTNNDVRSYAASLAGRDISKMEKLNEGFIIIGNESKGISENILKLANVSFTIPKKGEAESLNAAVATGIILSHLI